MHEITTQSRQSPAESIRAWDLPVRLVHWLLVVLVFASWLSSEIGGNAMTYHMWAGYAILALVLFRIAWGFLGSQHARFCDFVRGPGTVARYLGGLLRVDAPRFVGHNPAGGWSVLALLSSLFVQAATGMFANDEISTEGPLAAHVSIAMSDWLTTVHRYNFNVLLVLISLHVAAVLFYLLAKRENLINAMVTGRKRMPEGKPAAAGRMASTWRAAMILAIAAAAVAALVNFA
jgi:cytochrome b